MGGSAAVYFWLVAGRAFFRQGLFQAGPFAGRAFFRQDLFQAGPFSGRAFFRQGLLQAGWLAGWLFGLLVEKVEAAGLCLGERVWAGGLDQCVTFYNH